MPYEDKIMVASGDSEHPGEEEVGFETISHHGGSGFDPDNLLLSTNAPDDADEIITKESSAWYRKGFSKVWDYIKGKFQASSCEVAYGICNTNAITQEKVVTLSDADNWVLKKGCIIGVSFAWTSTVDDPTLNVNGTGAKSIKRGNSIVTSGGDAPCVAGYITYFMYNGTYWCAISLDVPATPTKTGAMSNVDKTRLNNIAVARYGGTETTSYIKIKINSTGSWMLAFTVHLYQGYRETSVRISGYNYGANHWYQPEARVISDSNNNYESSSIMNNGLLVYFGYDANWELWVGFAGGNYSGISITDVTNGYEQIADYSNLFTISNVSSLATQQTNKYAIIIPSHVGEVIMSTRLSSLAAVRQVYGTDTTWIALSGYMLRGATSGVTANSNAKDGGSDTVTLTGAQSGLKGHGHGFTQPTVNGGATNTGGMSANASHGHRIRREFGAVASSSYNPTNEIYAQIAGDKAGTKSWSGTPIESTSLAHTHSQVAHTHSVSGGAVSDAGASNATSSHSILPNYKNVYIWERTA